MLDLQPLAIAGLATASSVVYITGKRYLEAQRSDVAKLQHAPNGHWLWGNEYEAFESSCGEYYSNNADKLGQVYAIKGAFFHPDIVVAIDPAAISHIFTKHGYGFVKSPVIRPLVGRLIGRSLVWTEGEEHKQLRQVIAPVFSTEMVKSMEENIRAASDKLVESLQSHVMSADGQDTRINLLDWTFRATLDVIGSVGFGFDFQCGQSPESQEIVKLWGKLVSTGLSFAGFVGPIVLRTFPFISDLPVASIQAQGEILVLVKKLALEIVQSRKASGECVDGGKDLLSTLMRATGIDADSVEKDGDLDRLLEHIVTFVMVGHETTSSVINYTLWELSKDKESQDKLREELMSFQGSGRGGDPTYEEYQTKLPFLDAVCKEGLRLYPPASHTERVAANDDVLPLRYPVTSKTGEKLTSIKINKGQLIYVPCISINRSKAAWGPDAEEFRPDRWLAPNTLPAPSALTQGWSGIFSFLEGPRICVGYRLALFELKIVVSAMIKQFELSHTGEKIKCQFSATLQPRVVGQEDKGVQLPCNVKLVA